MRTSKPIAASIIAVSLLLIGCASTQYGNYSNASITTSTAMADNTVAYLASQYPPGCSRLAVQQPAKDAFGTMLIKRLRSRGYAVQEFNPDTKTANALTTPVGTSLRYIVNTISSNLYQVTTYVGSTSHSRAFMVTTDGKTHPAGPWVNEEKE